MRVEGAPVAAVTVCAASRPSSFTTIVAPAAPPQKPVCTAQQHNAVSGTHVHARGSRALPQPLPLPESAPRGPFVRAVSLLSSNMRS